MLTIANIVLKWSSFSRCGILTLTTDSSWGTMHLMVSWHKPGWCAARCLQKFSFKKVKYEEGGCWRWEAGSFETGKGLDFCCCSEPCFTLLLWIWATAVWQTFVLFQSLNKKQSKEACDIIRDSWVYGSCNKLNRTNFRLNLVNSETELSKGKKLLLSDLFYSFSALTQHNWTVDVININHHFI